MSRNRRSYSREFKEEAVRLAEGPGRSGHQVALELGISPSVLNRWRQQFGSNGSEAFPGKGRLSAQDEAIRRLERELACVKEERAILKKALAIFSQGPK
jgi:transposase